MKGTIDYGLFYKKSEKKELVGFSDSDFARNLDDRKSTFGYIFLLSGVAVSWSSRKQHIVTLSTTEVEIIAVASCACQGVWLRNFLEEVKYTQQSPIMLFCDNSLTIKLSKKSSLAWKKQTH